jgi:hypothetical protein
MSACRRKRTLDWLAGMSATNGGFDRRGRWVPHAACALEISVGFGPASAGSEYSDRDLCRDIGLPTRKSALGVGTYVL